VGITSTVGVGTIGALVLCAAASALDVKSGRIPNILTFGAAAVGFVVGATTHGLPGLGQAAAGWVVGCGLFLPFFLLGGMGAGDVKLLAALGAWLGPSTTLFVALYAGIAGGVMAVIVSAARGYMKQLINNLWGLLIFWRIAGLQPMPGLTLRTASSPRLPYALPISAGTVAALWFR
jgi:prepilin peptidase CpaA